MSTAVSAVVGFSLVLVSVLLEQLMGFLNNIFKEGTDGY
jgi:hypothetical protein